MNPDDPCPVPIWDEVPISLNPGNPCDTTPPRRGGAESGRIDDVAAVTVWGDFEVHLDKLLGRGGMGSVYKAWQKSLGRWVAVKVLDTGKSTDTLLVEGFLQKFKVEIGALAKLNDPR